ncbi:hypothetical protein FACS189413_00750 [Bacteroidia bacterium]|nr:hypothetical protein FACS189463_1340 [Bacteroidia bacterium]GHU66905.1 hypothetical protein FACS189413_00750 [Bacteroidia bacterium]
MYFGVYENVKNQLHFIFIYELHGGNARPRHHQANDGKLSGSMGFDSDGELVCTDKTIIYAINFGVPNTGIEPPSKIKFKVEGEEMYYNISKSEWESNSDK